MIELRAGGLTLAEVVAVAREDAEVELMEDSRDAMGESAAIVERLAASDGAHVRRLHGVRIARDDADPGGAPRAAAAGADPLARRRHGRAGRARGGASDDGAAGPIAGDGVLGGEAGGRRDDRGAS